MRAGRRNPRNICHWSFWEHLSSQLCFLGLFVILLHSIEVYLFKDNVVPRSLFPETTVWSSCYLKSMSRLLKTDHLASVIVAIVINKDWFWHDLSWVLTAYQLHRRGSGSCFGFCSAGGTWASLVLSESLTRSWHWSRNVLDSRSQGTNVRVI